MQIYFIVKFLFTMLVIILIYVFIVVLEVIITGEIVYLLFVF